MRLLLYCTLIFCEAGSLLLAGKTLVPAASPEGPSLPLLVRTAATVLPGDDAAVEKRPAEARLRLRGKKEPLPSLREVVFSPDGRLLAVRGEPADPTQPRVIDLWDTRTGQRIRRLTAHAVPMTSLRFSPDGRYLAAGQPEHGAGLQVWEVATGRLMMQQDGGRGRVFFLSGNRVAVVAAFGTHDIIRVHNIATGKEVQRFVMEESYRFAVAPDGSMLLSLRTEGRTDLMVVHIPPRRALQDRPRLRGARAQPTVFAFSPDGRTVAAGSSHRVDRRRSVHRVLVWELATHELVHDLTLHTRRILAMAFSPDNRYLATAGIDRTVNVWEIATGRLAHTFRGHEGPVTTLAFSPDGKTLASGSFDRTVILWDVAGRLKSFLPATPPNQADLSRLWDELAAGSPKTAYAAIGRIEVAARVAVPYFRQRVRAILYPAENKRVQQLLVELDADDSVMRHRAMQELRKLRKIAKPILIKTLQTTTSAEVRYRLRRILEDTQGTKRFSTADVRRLLRLIHALEHIGGQDAIATLRMIVADFPEPAVVDEAKKALRHLGVTP